MQTGGQGRLRLRALRIGEQGAALAQIGAQRAFGMVDRARHGPDSTGARLCRSRVRIRVVRWSQPAQRRVRALS
ncbi:hypothetical protein JCM13591A_29030 [Microbacterium xylanilyticum]